MEKQQLAVRYLQRQLSDGATTLKLKAIDKNTGQPYRTRNAWVLLKMRANDFLESKKGSKRIVIMPGLRGVGKTTLVSQLYTYLENTKGRNINQLYFPLDEAVERLGLSLNDVLEAYEELLGTRFEVLNKPTFIYIDEIQSDPAWPRIIKFVNERTSNVFIVCTGSSATQLQLLTDADLQGRRGYVDKLYPLSFVEQQVLMGKETPIPKLKEKIRTALYLSDSAQQVFQRLKILKPHVNREWIKYDRSSIRKFLQSGTMPHLVFESDISVHTQFIGSMVDRIIEADMQALGKFSADTIPLIKRAIYVLAECDSISIEKLMEYSGVKSRATMYNILDAFISAELLIKVPAYGTNLDAVRSPARYMFMSPAIRSGMFSIVGIAATEATRQGLLLQDYAALHYYREFVKTGRASLTHPFGDSEADFILRLDGMKQIAIEIGLGSKTFKQAEATVNSKACDYGLVFSNADDIEINSSFKVVRVPLDYLFLM
jgi:predicted AAA+ superfamily ATPase